MKFSVLIMAMVVVFFSSVGATTCMIALASWLGFLPGLFPKRSSTATTGTSGTYTIIRHSFNPPEG